MKLFITISVSLIVFLAGCSDDKTITPSKTEDSNAKEKVSSLEENNLNFDLDKKLKEIAKEIVDGKLDEKQAEKLFAKIKEDQQDTLNQIKIKRCQLDFYIHHFNNALKAKVLLDDIKATCEDLYLKSTLEYLKCKADIDSDLFTLDDEYYTNNWFKKIRPKYIKDLKEVIFFPIFENRFDKITDDLKKIYIKASIDYMDLAMSDEAKEVAFWNFLHPELCRLFSSKYKLISQNAPPVFKAKQNVYYYLKWKASLKSTDDELKKVINSIIKEMDKGKI